MELKELKDWLFLAVQLIIILMLLVAIGNQMAMEKTIKEKIEDHDWNIQTEIRETAFKLDGNMKLHVYPVMHTVGNIANKMGVYSWCNDDGINSVRENYHDPYNFKVNAKFWGVNPAAFELREKYLRGTSYYA